MSYITLRKDAAIYHVDADEKVTLRGVPNESAVERAALPDGVTVTVTGASDQSSGDTWWPVTTGRAGEQGWAPEELLAPTGNARDVMPSIRKWPIDGSAARCRR